MGLREVCVSAWTRADLDARSDDSRGTRRYAGVADLPCDGIHGTSPFSSRCVPNLSTKRASRTATSNRRCVYILSSPCEHTRLYQNILLTRAAEGEVPTVKVADFGLAKMGQSHPLFFDRRLN